ncbi:MAG TPA: hypothetical protein PKX27_03370 [Bacteroidales bacterium]|nr:hypothetical protein [Bacteroidales bacterium]HOX74132.1 hypothetical protein [Bacteroidales bacterium]HPM86997.1 hypothetical protein [Bacteroidales bacterium]HQM68331.1 hypothetical protein [Bacteroidales bacterium]
MDSQINITISYNQLFELVRQLPVREKQKLLTSLIKENLSKSGNDTILTHFASEETLAKDWLSPEEDKAWKDL